MKVLSDLTTPAFVVNRQSFINNCLRVSRTARDCGMNLRPHIKTHKTIEGALLQADPSKYSSEKNDDIGDETTTARVTGFVASTIPEVKLLISGYKNHGNCFGDILYGVPICLSKIPTIARFLIENPSIFIHVMIDNHEQVDAIEEYTKKQSSQNKLRWTAFLKVDTGYHRAGVADDEKGVELAIRIIKSPVIDFRGIYSHCGHSYDISNKKTLQEIAQTDLSRMKSFLQSILRDDDVIKHLSQTIPLTISVGATPSTFSLPPSSSPLKISGQTITLEMHPGNYTFFDRQQQYTKACPNDASVSCRILSRVIGRYPDRGTILLDAGAIALSKDGTMQGGVGAIAGYPYLECFKASQEVTLVRVDEEERRGGGGDFPFDEFPLGRIVGLLPNHSCLAAASFDRYYVIKESEEMLIGDEEIVDEWIPVKGW